jgi:hypothetical protein
MGKESAKAYLSAMVVAAAISVPATASASSGSENLENVTQRVRTVLIEKGAVVQDAPPNVDNSGRNPSPFKEWDNWNNWDQWDQFSKYNDIF